MEKNRKEILTWLKFHLRSRNFDIYEISRVDDF